MNLDKKKWIDALGYPKNKFEANQAVLIKKYSFDECDAEVYHQKNGENTFQKIIMVFPKDITTPRPAVIVPFYFPEAMLGMDIETGEELPKYKNIEMMLHLVRRGYIAACAQTFHLTYYKSNRGIYDFYRWTEASKLLLKDNPNWTGMAKLIFDTKLLTDLIESDSRVNSDKIGIAGHSLGGKMAFYSGCLDDRIKVILASDFGIRWEQSNWSDNWYWGDKVDRLIQDKMDHVNLLNIAGGKPFFLIAGEFDDDSSFEFMKMATVYNGKEEKLGFINHATGHRPTLEALSMGYDFIDKYLK